MTSPSSQPTTADGTRGCFDCDRVIERGESHYAGVPVGGGLGAYLCPACHTKRFPATTLVDGFGSDPEWGRKQHAADQAADVVVEFREPLGPPWPIGARVPAAEPDPVDHPPHYKSGGIEAIDVIEAFDLGFCLGNTVKYVLRAGRKGDAVTDLKKARWYLEREIARIEGAS